MITNLIISVGCLIIAILLFRNYNNGKGGSLGSLKNRIKYILSILLYIAFIIFLNKGYYHNDNQQYNQTTKELNKEYFLLEKEICKTKNYASNVVFQEKQHKVRTLIQHLDYDNHKEYDNYFNIIICIICTFLCYVFAFTFKNKILG